MLLLSAIYTLPGVSTQTLCGLYNNELVAAPPSPLLPIPPVPATVVMIPVDAVTYAHIYGDATCTFG